MARQRSLWLAIAMAVALFAIDLLVPRGYAVGVLYVVVVATAVRSSDPAHALWLAALSTLLLIADVALGARGAPLAVTLPNRALSLLAIWITAGLVSLHVRRERALAAERARSARLWQAALDAAPDGMLVVERAGEIRYANAAAHTILGWHDAPLVGHGIEEAVPLEQVDVHRDARATYGAAPARRPMSPCETTARRRDGSLVAVQVALSPMDLGDGEPLVVAAVRDVSEQRKLEQRIRAVQRMESIGRLAGGIAHDFNNLLGVIISYGAFVRDGVRTGNAAASDVDELMAAADRAAALTRQLLAFSRRQVIAPRLTSLDDVIGELDRMLRRILGEDVALEARPTGPSLWAVEVDPTQMEQVVMNLAVNARDAMPRGGRLLIETANVALDASYAAQHPEVEAGHYVLLAVTDTGEGMREDVRVRVFEPFFTTKPPGAGTGLGLATVYGIVKQARGHIWVYSELGRGSTFKIYLPRAAGDPRPLPARAPAPSVHGGKEAVLLVEDEAALRNVMARRLRRAGYAVVEASNGADALLKVEALRGEVDLVITDVVMPHMGGRELAARLHEQRPAVRVLFLSGYTENAIVHHGVLEPGLLFLQKPFTPDQLLRRVRAVLDGVADDRQH